MIRKRRYDNIVEWDLLGMGHPEGAALDMWWALVDQHPELSGARIFAMDKHPDTGCTVYLDIELERTMGPGVRRAETVRRIGAAHRAEIASGLDSTDEQIMVTAAVWYDGQVGIRLNTKVCSCHREHLDGGERE